jgi:predicted metal-dependent hydrolase
MRADKLYQMELRGRWIEYRLVASRSARKLRLRVGPNGIEVVQPPGRTGDDVSSFLDQNAEWMLDQLQRVERLRKIRVPQGRQSEILFRGQRTRVRIDRSSARSRENLVALIDGEIVVRRGSGSRTPASRSLENWLRREARAEIEKHLETVALRIRQRPRQVYVMGQRTKWGNCSAMGNLAFNWRLILAPDFVLRYLVTHEAVHLAVATIHSETSLRASRVSIILFVFSRLSRWAEIARQWRHIDVSRVCHELRV